MKHLGRCALVAVIACAGCSGTPRTKTAATKPATPTHLALLGIHALEVGASLEDCKRAFPPPEDAKQIPVDVPPGWPHTSWGNNDESFAAAFKKGGGVVKAIHRLRIADMNEAEETLTLYVKWFGKGTRRDSKGYVEVIYVQGNEKLTLRAIQKGDDCTFNEILEDTSAGRQPVPAGH